MCSNTVLKPFPALLSRLLFTCFVPEESVMGPNLCGSLALIGVPLTVQLVNFAFLKVGMVGVARWTRKLELVAVADPAPVVVLP